MITQPEKQSFFQKNGWVSRDPRLSQENHNHAGSWVLISVQLAPLFHLVHLQDKDPSSRSEGWAYRCFHPALVDLGYLYLAGEARPNSNKEKLHSYNIGSLENRVINGPVLPGSEGGPAMNGF